MLAPDLSDRSDEPMTDVTTGPEVCDDVMMTCDDVDDVMDDTGDDTDSDTVDDTGDDTVDVSTVDCWEM